MTDKMREAFEAWYSEGGTWPHALLRAPDGSYKDPSRRRN